MYLQQQMEIEASLHNPQVCKADISFYQAFTSLAKSTSFFLFLNIIYLAIFVALIPISLIRYSVSYGHLVICLILCVVSSGLGVIYYASLWNRVFSSVPLFMILAQSTKHAVDKQPATDFSSFQSCTSRLIFVAQNELKIDDLDEAGRKMHLDVAKKTVNAVIRSQFGWTKQLQNLYSLVSLASMIYAIIVLAEGDQPTLDKVVLIVYVVLMGLMNLPLIIVLLLVGISPIICLLAVVYCCVCGVNPNASKFIDLPAQSATTEQAINMGGDCSICFMSITEGERVYMLPCSDKHLFHCRCLRQWTKVKNTCPNCRAAIPMTDVDRYSRQEEE